MHLLCPCNTAQYAPQGMEHRPGARWLVATHPRTTSAVYEVANEGTDSTESTRAESSGVSEEVVSNAEGRVAKLEAAMAALGESDPTYPALQEALKKAKGQIHVRHVEERVASSKTFLERAKKRIGSCCEEVVQAQEVLAKAQANLQS